MNDADARHRGVGLLQGGLNLGLVAYHDEFGIGAALQEVGGGGGGYGETNVAAHGIYGQGYHVEGFLGEGWAWCEAGALVFRLPLALALGVCGLPSIQSRYCKTVSGCLKRFLGVSGSLRSVAELRSQNGLPLYSSSE